MNSVLLFLHIKVTIKQEFSTYGVNFDMRNLYYGGAARVHLAILNAGENITTKINKKASKYIFGGALISASSTVFAQSGVVGILDRGDELVRNIVDFIMVVAVLMGVGGILYGLKLIMDKSNDRENVKNSHIAFSLIGGACLIVLWFIVQAFAETVGGAAQIGQEASF